MSGRVERVYLLMSFAILVARGSVLLALVSLLMFGTGLFVPGETQAGFDA